MVTKWTAELAFVGTRAWWHQDFSRQIPAQSLGPLSGFKWLCSKLHFQGRKRIGSGNMPIQTKAEESRTVSPALSKLCWIGKSKFSKSCADGFYSRANWGSESWSDLNGDTQHVGPGVTDPKCIWVKSLCYLYGPTWPLRRPGPHLYLPASLWVCRSPCLLPVRAHPGPWPEMAWLDWQVLALTNAFTSTHPGALPCTWIFPLLLPRPPYTAAKMAPHSQKAHPCPILLFDLLSCTRKWVWYL